MAKTKGAKKAKLRPIIINNGPVSPAAAQKSRKVMTQRIKRVSWHDDGVGLQKFADPAILAVGTVPPVTPEFRYSKDELLKLRKAPCSQKRPEFLDSNYYNNNGVWDPEPWHYSNKANDAPVENGARPNETNEGHKQRRPGDPRERIRKEQDGIVLSPQRRSFNSGCFVPAREPLRPNRAHSPLGSKGEPAHITHRDLNSGPPARRIGSGRILSWDFQEKSDVDNDFGYRRDRRDTDRDRDERFDRRSFSREFDGNKEKDRHLGRNNNNNNGRYSNRRISNDNREEEPEWFSSGPMSQTDTIELRGFDENEKLGNKKKTSAQKKKLQQQQKEQQAVQQQKSKDGEKTEDGTKKVEQASRSTPKPQDGGASGTGLLKPRSSPMVEKESGGGDGPHVAPADDNSFNFEDILKCDTIPGISGLLSNGVESGDAAGSRFSRWFRREKSPPKKNEGSRRSSLQDQDHHHIIKNLLSETFNEPSVTIPQPGDSESYFAPISPAASSVLPQQQQQQGKSLNLIEMLQRSNKLNRGAPQMHNEPPPQIKGLGDGPGPGKILCLEELEATIMQGIEGSNKHSTKPEDDLNAFKRLFSQASAGINHHMSNGPVLQKPMSIMEMLSHSQQQDEAARLASQRIPSNIPPLLTDMSYKLQQVQNHVQQQQKQQAQLEIFSKLMNASIAQQQTRASPLQDMGINQRELLQRPEAQAILQGLKRGDITPQHLYQQLANPAMQPRHRDLLLTILKMQVTGGIPQSASPVQPPHHMYQQQLRVSPLPNAMHQRIPSPRELQVHTQNIMQRALIKKKLEEQEENYRKKQAQQRGTSPAKTASPTPLAFTPTAVLRKMTADKDDASKESKGDKMPQGRALTGMRAPQQPQQPQQVAPQQPQNWNNQFPQQLKQPAGRPIVKANNNYQQPSQTQQQEQFFQQQRLLQQQQQQQRKNQQTFGTNFPSQSQQFPQLTQQQLRAQHQNVRAQHQQQQPFGGQPQQQSWTQQMLQGQGFGDNRQVGRGGIDGDLSPTSNQLARWFSPDLLDRARKGKLPGLPPNAVPQHALSLEEVERQTTPVGHN